ncbi:hypothetical protein CPB83DRAFT_768595 [Crepidotus variabilis]|uniref:BTB domain-containing protein n=1 Tax=Crepidotus variabilis TaxID=179855 RepID=A0A9P6ED87_9AGAR|nr:hypothetical protein CPB83DRAFT_768595 [Crepidotus variabilis]
MSTSKKRARVDDIDSDNEPAVQAIPPTRSSDFWFSDGSVVLEAESTRFRVHSSMLALHSTVFKGMLQHLKIGKAHHKMIDGCPFIPLDDSEEEVTYMLSALYEKNPRPRPAPFSLFAALLRLGIKYDVKCLRNEAIDILESALPTTLEKYQKLNTKTNGIIDYSSNVLMDVIDLVTETSVLSCLPAAYLILSEDIDSIMYGATREDDTAVVLDEGAKNAIICGRNKLLKDAPFKAFSWVKGSGSACGQKRACMAALHDAMEDLWRNQVQQLTCFETFKKSLLSRFCATCQAEYGKTHRDEQRKMWNDLPTYFGWTSWKDLPNIHSSK